MSNPKVQTPDTAYIATIATNGYGDATVSELNEIRCAFFSQYNQQHATNQDLTQSDAYAYIDVDNEFAKGLGYKLQGRYFKIAPFGVDEWYVVTAVQVAQRKLLGNAVNNVLLNLQIVAAPLGGN